MEAFRVLGTKTVDQVLAYEVESTFTSETRKWAAGVTAQEIGTVYGVVTANGEIKPHDNAAVDGTQNVAGVSLVRGAAGDAIPGIERGPAILFAAGLIWKAGISVPNKAAGIAALLAKNILVR